MRDPSLAEALDFFSVRQIMVPKAKFKSANTLRGALRVLS